MIDDEIRFKRPFKSQSRVSFSFEPVSSGTKVTWNMDGSLPWFMFWMKPMMESFISMDYDRGLSMMKEWIETGTILSDVQAKGVQSVGPIRMAGVRNSVDFEKIGESMVRDYKKVNQEFERLGLPMKQGISVYHHFNIKKKIMEYTCGYMVDKHVDAPGINNWDVGSVQALRVDHIGSYGNLGNAWSAANQIARYKKLKQSKVGTIEIYRNTPEDTEPADLVTEIYLPLK